jgi:predicted HAD superfamily Cof-like phosphohydrolase
VSQQNDVSYFEDVGAFHRQMELPYFTDVKPRNLTTAEFNFRTAAIFEELREFIEAHARGDIASAADALVDLVYFALGTAHYMAVPFDEIWDAVQDANMLKRRWREGDPIKPRVSTRPFDVVKPEGWRAPDVHKILKDHIDIYFK